MSGDATLARAKALSVDAGLRAKGDDPAAAEAAWREALRLRAEAGFASDADQRADASALAWLLIDQARPAEAEPFARVSLDGQPAGPARAMRLATLAHVPLRPRPPRGERAAGPGGPLGVRRLGARTAGPHERVA